MTDDAGCRGKRHSRGQIYFRGAVDPALSHSLYRMRTGQCRLAWAADDVPATTTHPLGVMQMKLTPYLMFFNGDCREAFDFYAGALGGQIILRVT